MSDFTTEWQKIQHACEWKVFDTHCHLDYLKIDTAQLIGECSSHGINNLLTVAVSPENLLTVVDLAQNFEHVYGSQGLHPHDADKWNDEVRQLIEKNIAHPKITAIGEIGLDYYRPDQSPTKEKQREVFENQLQMAKTYKLPVIIHTREAEEDTRAILRNFSGQLVGGVFHSFTSSLDLADFALREGFFLGVNGILTFKNADNLRAVFAQTPWDRILLETDAPFLAPIPFRGRENLPLYLPWVAQSLLQLKKVAKGDYQRHLQTIWQNSRKLFTNSAR